MKLKSIKSIIQVSAVVVLLLCILTVVSISTTGILNTAEHKHHKIGMLEIDFSQLVAEEKEALKRGNELSELKAQFKTLTEAITEAGFNHESMMLADRLAMIETLYQTQQETTAQYADVRLLIPDLIASVRYIHKHHIAYLKNLLRRGHDTQDWDTNRDFKRSPIKSASELDIISSAVSIQNSLLEVFALFYKLLAGEPASTLKDEFQHKINLFYTAVNSFEDFSLDAQDGLLVEELLITGRQFEGSFKNLLTLEDNINKLTKQLEADRIALNKKLTDKSNFIHSKNDRLRYHLKLIQYISFGMFLLLLGFLFQYGRKIIRAFRRTIHETKRIQQDLSYQIKLEKNDYEEFLIVFSTLNTMARVIETNVNELRNAQHTLSQRVEERTADLNAANKKLKKEIEDRMDAERKRIALEARLNRAEKMEAIGMLAGGVAHDLNNILSGIVSYPELLLLDMPKQSPLRKPISIIQQSGEKAASIVQDLLTLARRGVRVTEIVNLNQITKDYLASPEFAKLSQDYNDIKLQYTPDPALLDFIGSPVHLSKTVMNLVANAFEAGINGGEVLIQTTNQYIDAPVAGYDTVKEGDYVVLTISDNGIGISEEDIQRIFEPFYTKKVMGRSGTGLGMAVVWGTVKDHKGYIDISSRLNTGTEIRLYFPVPKEVITEAPKYEVSMSDIMGNREDILIIDDVPEQLEIATSILNKLNYNVHAVSSGEAGVDYLKTNAVDLLLLDMVMEPGADGLDTYKEVLTISPNQKAIIASGFSETGRVKEAMAIGAGAYVKKPYTIMKVGEAIRNELDRPLV